jgi:hypothetical protein
MSIRALKTAPASAAGTIVPLPAASARSSECQRLNVDLTDAGSFTRLAVPDDGELVELDIDATGGDTPATARVWYAAVPSGHDAVEMTDAALRNWLSANGRRLTAPAGGCASRVLRVEGGDVLLLHSDTGADVVAMISLGT